ncbi:hypothetical protein CDL15_Pgr002437 [Punica granatum]|uniref:WD repeat-containing protein 44 n=1 Tax=Punica granatum TaxID=22663 RepID=A0A218XUZ2_PUNGR|nr:hypothetical protein CDL15_Pgr002437 [Punica granatum]
MTRTTTPAEAAAAASAAATDDEEEERFYESLDRIVSSASCSCSNSDTDDPEPDPGPDPNSAPLRFPVMGYDVWLSEPSSVSERRSRLLHDMGLGGEFVRSVSSDRLWTQENDGGPGSVIPRSKSESSADRNLGPGDDTASVCSSSFVPIDDSSASFVNSHNNNTSNTSHSSNSNGVRFAINGSLIPGPNKPPIARHSRRADEIKSESPGCVADSNGDSVHNSGNVEALEGAMKCEENCDGVNGNILCTIKDLDNGKEFVVDEIREDGGSWNQLKVKEVGTDRQLTLEEFDMTVGHSPIVQELMRRQHVEDGYRDSLDLGTNGGVGINSKLKKKNSWFKNFRSKAGLVAGGGGHKERRSSDEKDTSSEKGGRRSSSATDDSQDSSFHGPERVRVRQYGKSCKEVTALYKSQEIQAHNGSIWSIKFSLDGRYLASAGEDCVIHIWQVVESERKGELLTEKPEDGNLVMFWATGSPEPNTLSPTVENFPERKRRGRSSISRKSMNFDHVVVPETVFALTEKPICSFQGHFDDVLDLSWSKSQHLLSSSMDKTVRLWHLSSKTCLKVFSHSDYVTCIQFNPVDDRYFISGSLDAKVRIWSIPDRQVVDWNDLHEMVTAACYTPDGQGALVGSYKGSCRLYNTSENKLQQKSQINLQNKKKKSQYKKITGFQFAPGSSSEVLVTSADSRIRVVDGVDLVHKFKGFRNTNSQISAFLAANGKYVVSASEDSYVYVWKHEADSRPSRNKGIPVTRSYEHFHCQDVSMAIPWSGMTDSWGFHDSYSPENNGLLLDSNNLDEASTANHPPTPVENHNTDDGSKSASGCTNSPLHGTISSASNSYFFDRISATWPEEKLPSAAKSRSPRVSVDFSSGMDESAWGLVIVTAGLRGEIRTFQNFGLPVRI